MSSTTRAVLALGPLFDAGAGWLPTARQLQEAGLPDGSLAAVRLHVVRVTAAGRWHPVPPHAPSPGCARARRAAADGRALTRRRTGLLAVSELGLCPASTAQIRPRGLAGAYLDLARHIIAAHAWTRALEEAAPHDDWPACRASTGCEPDNDAENR